MNPPVHAVFFRALTSTVRRSRRLPGNPDRKNIRFLCNFPQPPRHSFVMQSLQQNPASAFRILLAGLGASFLAATPAHADNGTASNPYTESFNLKHSYYHHTVGDDAALTASNIASGDERGYIKITGSGRKVTGLNPGDYLHLKVNGTANGGAFRSAGLFTDGTAIRGRTGYQNRFQGIATRQLQVLSLRDESAYPNFKGISGQWSGQATAQQSSDMKHFRISPASGSNPGIIVRVPADATHLFKSADVNSFSKVTGSSTITLTKIDPANRPRFFLHPDDLVITEGTSSSARTYNLRVRRDTQTAYQVRVNYTLSHITTNNVAEHGNNDVVLPAPGTFVFGENETEKLIPVTIVQDNIHEGDETFRLNLSIDPRNNPNEAYVEEPNASSKDFIITLKDDDPKPVVSFSPISSGPGHSSVTHASVDEPVSGTVPYNIQVRLDRPSKFATQVWYLHRAEEVATHAGGGTPAATGADYSYTFATGHNYIIIPAGGETGAIPIVIHSDNIYEGNEKIVFHLGASSSNHTYNPDGPNARLALTIKDGNPVPLVTLSYVGDSDSLSVSEPNPPGEVTTRTLRLTRSPISPHPTEVSISYAGTATRGLDKDYYGPDKVTIPPNSNSVDFNIDVYDDPFPEFEETIEVTATSAKTNEASRNAQGTVTLTIEASDGSSEDQTLAPDYQGGSKPVANSGIRVDIPPLFQNGTLVAMWKIAGEPSWRMPGTAATGLAPGFHEIEFRPFEGFATPFRRIVEIGPGQQWLMPDPPAYERLDALEPESVTVHLYPPEAVAHGAKWKLEGENAWRDSGTTAPGIPIGVHKIVFKAAEGYALPRPIHRRVSPGENNGQYSYNSFSGFYTAPEAPGIIRPAPLADAETEALPHSLVGRISSSAGFATGTAVRENVVLTAAHALFDDLTLSHAVDVRWHHQAQKDHYLPAAKEPQELSGEMNAVGARVHTSSIVPRGLLILSGYAERRRQDPHVGTGTPESQNLDVAAAFFGKEVARGGRAGILCIDGALPPGHWLNFEAVKTLVGYAHDDAAEENLGKIHASAPADIAFTRAYERVWHSFELRAGGGVSGGPLFIREDATGIWRQTAIYLGGADRGIFRELDKEAADLITAAGILAGDDNNTGGGITHSNVTNFAHSGQGALRVVIEPAAAHSAGAGWKIVGLDDHLSGSRLSGTESNGLDPKLYTIRLNSIEGYHPPATQTVLVKADQRIVVTFTYEPEYTPLELWRKEHFGSAENTGPAADHEDADGDGMRNLDEYTAGTNPKNPADVFKVLSTTRAANAFTLVAPGKAGRIYILERRHDLGSGSWQTVPGATAGPLAADGPVTLTDPASPPDRAFYRARVSLP